MTLGQRDSFDGCFARMWSGDRYGQGVVSGGRKCWKLGRGWAITFFDVESGYLNT